jgi:hypothetical protein
VKNSWSVIHFIRCDEFSRHGGAAPGGP